MNKLLKLVTVAVMLLASFSAMAEKGDWYVAPSIVYSDDDGNRLIDDTFGGIQVQFGREMSRHFSLEGLLLYHDIDGFPEQTQLEFGVNAVGKFLPDSLFSPYIIGGLGYLRADVGEPDFGGLPPAGTTASNGTATAGIGVLVAFGDSPWSLRAEWRMRRTFDSDDSLTDQVAGIGVQYSFGGRAQRAAPAAVAMAAPPQEAEPLPPLAPLPDSDGDGVTDDRDRCPGTLAGVAVDAMGCEQIRMKNVYFDTESAVLSARAQGKLDATAELLARHPELKVEIAGHADSRGPEDYNQALSERRAEAVRGYLEKQGIEASRMTASGYGETRPARSNATALGQSDNRRVELNAMGR